MNLLLQIKGTSRLRFSQGLMGAPTPKPTDLLLVNMPCVLQHLHEHRVRVELPRDRALGRDERGHWRTAILKEYPPSLCKALAVSFLHCIHECPVDDSGSLPPPHFISTCAAMECTEYGTEFGHDFAE